MASKITLGPLRDSLTTPGNENVLGKSSVWASDFHKRKLDLSFREFVNQINQFALYKAVCQST